MLLEIVLQGDRGLVEDEVGNKIVFRVSLEPYATQIARCKQIDKQKPGLAILYKINLCIEQLRDMQGEGLKGVHLVFKLVKKNNFLKFSNLDDIIGWYPQPTFGTNKQTGAAETCRGEYVTNLYEAPMEAFPIYDRIRKSTKCQIYYELGEFSE